MPPWWLWICAPARPCGKSRWPIPWQGYSITSAPLVVKDKIVTGVAGGEYGIRGFVDAYDPASGKRLWRFYTIPGPGEFGHDTWEGDSWQQGGGATWLTGTFDPEADTLFWPVGNPGPDINGDVRKGDNLFTCSVVALDPEPASASGITSSPPTTRTIGIPPKTWCWWTACTTARTASCCCTPTATACSTSWTAPMASSSPPRPTCAQRG